MTPNQMAQRAVAENTRSRSAGARFLSSIDARKKAFGVVPGLSGRSCAFGFTSPGRVMRPPSIQIPLRRVGQGDCIPRNITALAGGPKASELTSAHRACSLARQLPRHSQAGLSSVGAVPGDF